jgi:hypothetical protein
MGRTFASRPDALDAAARSASAVPPAVECSRPQLKPLGSVVVERLLIDLERELATARRFLERYPSGRGEWQPHEKSRTLSALATHVAGIPHHGVTIQTSAEMDIATRQPQSADEPL